MFPGPSKTDTTLSTEKVYAWPDVTLREHETQGTRWTGGNTLDNGYGGRNNGMDTLQCFTYIYIYIHIRCIDRCMDG